MRTFVPDDPRFPVEKGAATSFFAADGSRTTVGKPLQLFDPDGSGTLLMGAGRALFDENGDLISATGQRAALDADLADYYCPN